MNYHETTRGHDYGDVFDKLIDQQLERLGWLEPRHNNSTEEAGSAQEAPAADEK